jgi:acetyl esterase/lipase
MAGMIVLEPRAAEFARVTAQSQSLESLGVSEARRRFEELQSASVPEPGVDETWAVVGTDARLTRVRICRPVGGADRVLPVILYLHGGGWVLGSAKTHDRLVRELVVGVDAAVVFVEYSRAPAARYPIALEQSYAAARWVRECGGALGLDASRMAVAGDSAGGNLAAALALTAKRRGDISFVHQSLYYPVTDAAQDTDSYCEFAEGPHLTSESMAWFWDCYLSDHRQRQEATASPLRADLSELAALPPAFLIVNEYDVLRDEGEAYAHKLTAAGVRCCCVRYAGALHDFMVLDAVRDTIVADTAIAQAIHELRTALHA